MAFIIDQFKNRQYTDQKFFYCKFCHMMSKGHFKKGSKTSRKSIRFKRSTFLDPRHSQSNHIDQTITNTRGISHQRSGERDTILQIINWNTHNCDLFFERGNNGTQSMAIKVFLVGKISISLCECLCKAIHVFGFQFSISNVLYTLIYKVAPQLEFIKAQFSFIISLK
ncbi:unnamed protein product [Paramecium sonneborni]|uniref:Uncharacterized protein n=1 Tax=Paramecium sonneborni TaxID=65129 RepID=A0A8S1RBV8_9CILI|nr:unnamed protein product [Paramecium sonneborni]